MFRYESANPTFYVVQVFGASLKGGIANRAQGPGDDRDVVTGSFKNSTRDVHGDD